MRHYCHWSLGKANVTQSPYRADATHCDKCYVNLCVSFFNQAAPTFHLIGGGEIKKVFLGLPNKYFKIKPQNF